MKKIIKYLLNKFTDYLDLKIKIDKADKRIDELEHKLRTRSKDLYSLSEEKNRLESSLKTVSDNWKKAVDKYHNLRVKMLSNSDSKVLISEIEKIIKLNEKRNNNI